MRPRIKFIVGADAEPTGSLAVCIGILKDQNVPFDIEVNQMEMMRRSRGRCHPLGGYVIEFPGGNTGFNYRHLVDWFNAEGLWQLC